MFNYPQLQRFQLSTAQLPEGSVILNMPQSFYDEFKYHIWASLLFIIFQTSVIFLLIKNIGKRKQAESALQEAYGELELKVQDRTKELHESNSQLEKEIEVLKALIKQ